MTALERLGRGWGFPVAPAPEDRLLPLLAGAEKVRQSILLILETEPGERVMRPGFGCGLRRYLMKPNTTSTRALIQRDVELALATWEPRIRVRAVRVTPGADPARVDIAIDYAHARDGSAGALVYPFYLE